ARGVEPVRTRAPHLGDRGGVVHGADGVTFGGDDLHALGLHGLFEFLCYRKWEQIVAGEHRHALDVLALRAAQLADWHRSGLVAGERRENELEALVENLSRRG